jgi:tetratricopeptide (TPR) repeat protein
MFALVVVALRLACFLAALSRGAGGPRSSLWSRPAMRATEVPWTAMSAVFGVTMLSLVLLSLARVEVWSSEESVWRDTIGKRPDCARAYSSLGMVRLHEAGRRAAVSDDKRAEQLYLGAVGAVEAALQLGPYHVEGWNNLGKAYLELDRDIPTAERSAARADDPLIWAEQALARGIKVGDLLARADYKRGRLGPAVPLCWNNLGLVYRRRALRALPPLSAPDVGRAAGELRKAIGCIERAVEIDAAYAPGWSNLGALRVQLAGLTGAAKQRQQLAGKAQEELARSLATGRGRPGAIRHLISASLVLGQSGQALNLVHELQRRLGVSGEDSEAALCEQLGLESATRLEDILEFLPNGRVSAAEVAATAFLLERAARLRGSQSLNLLNARARLSELAGRPAEARRFYLESLERAPDQATRRLITDALRRLVVD